MLNTRIKCCQILELNTIWFLFENLCIRDLRIYADFLDGNIYHYRDKNGLECDAVIHLRNGSYGLIEIKLGGDTAIEEAVKSLKKTSFLLILCANAPYAYKRKDGIYVVPITKLKP